MAEHYELRPRDGTIAEVIPFLPGQRRHAGFRKAQRLTVDALHTETVIFRDILINLFTEAEEESLFGNHIIVGHATTDTDNKMTITTEKKEGTFQFKIEASHDEYEWLTSGLGVSDWREADRDAGRILGRYYRLTGLTAYVMDATGTVNPAADAFTTLPLGTDKEFCTSALDEQDVVDIATHRIAGGLAIASMGLPDETSDAMRLYLAQTLEDRILFTKKMIIFAQITNGNLPKDFDVDIMHWKGVCTPLESQDVAPDSLPKLWSPNRQQL